ncbi:DNA repair protein [Phlyctema vagabunda]|uniref:Double-strand break repair protein n=1 Tax=Phlyctema vagabunda TaxID=108571 RepID=A0ABR4PEH0_9HELO
MCLAREQDVDMVLLAGDLFHENKPSRKSLFQVMRSLRMNCLGDKPCELEMLSDAQDIFQGAFNHVNYEDPDINVAIPVFSIHGNHDDPTGDGHFCSLDLLQVSGLLNYFGRIPESDNLHIKPVLLQKGQTKLALYGMSNVRDERLFRTFRDGKVKFYKPSTQQKDWFNLMAVHQNHHAHNETGYLPENFLPDFMDLVVWGHEHECLIDPRYNPETLFHVMQPGSSVATSLVPGEAVAKHVAILNITGKDFKVEKHRIKSVRPFVTRDLVLATDKRFKNLAKLKDNRQQVTAELMNVVEELIEEAKTEWLSIQDEEIPAEEIPLPLIRLKVEYTAPEGGKFDCENPQRFSNRFVKKVANVNDVVVFYRKKVGATRKSNGEKDDGLPEDTILSNMAIDSVKIDRLVKEFLTAQSLKILPQAPFGDAMIQFVDKDDKHAMETFVDVSLTAQVKEMLNLDDYDEEELDNAMERHKAKLEEQFRNGTLKRAKRAEYHPRPANWDSDLDGDWEDQPAAMIREAAEDDTPVPATKSGRGAAAAADSDNESMMSTTVPTAKKPAAKRAPAKKAPAKAKAAPAKKAPARGRKKAATPVDDDDDLIMLDDDDPPPPPKSQPKRAAATRGRQTQLNFSSQAVPPSKQPAVDLSDDEISDDAFDPVQTSSRRR